MRTKTNYYAIVAFLTLVIVGYLPVLTGDYVPQDQWRAFRYNLNIDGREKWSTCVQNIPNFYIATGRPLVWIPECVEHGFIQNVEDYKILRLPALAVVLITMLIGGAVLRRITQFYWQSVYLSVPLVLAPGYAFMFYQGNTAGGVLIAVMTTLASVYLVSFVFRDGLLSNFKEKILYGVIGALLFLVALFNYSAFAFIAFGTVFLTVMFDGHAPLVTRISEITKTFLFYGIVCLLYLLMAKGIAHLVPAQDLGGYKLSIAESSVVFTKMLDIGKRLFDSGDFVNFGGVPYLGLAFIAGASLMVPAGVQKASLMKQGTAKLVFLLLFPVVAVFGSLPVIISYFAGFSTRHVLPGAFMVGLIIFFVLLKLSLWVAGKLHAPETALGLTFLVVGVFAAQQHRISLSLVQDSIVEIRAVRVAVDAIVQGQGLHHGERWHVLRPDGGPFSRQDSWFDSGEYMPATTQNTEHIKEMVSMALRQRLEKHELWRIHIRDCRLDPVCGMPPPQPYEIILTQSHAGDPDIPWLSEAKIINLSSLNWRDHWK